MRLAIWTLWLWHVRRRANRHLLRPCWTVNAQFRQPRRRPRFNVATRRIQRFVGRLWSTGSGLTRAWCRLRRGGPHNVRGGCLYGGGHDRRRDGRGRSSRLSRRLSQSRGLDLSRRLIATAQKLNGALERQAVRLQRSGRCALALTDDRGKHNRTVNLSAAATRGKRSCFQNLFDILRQFSRRVSREIGAAFQATNVLGDFGIQSRKIHVAAGQNTGGVWILAQR